MQYNCRELSNYLHNFMFFLRTSSERSQQNLFPHLYFPLFLYQAYRKNIFYVTVILQRLLSSLWQQKGSNYCRNTFNCKEQFNRLLTVPHQQNPKPVFKTTLSRALSKITDPEQVCTYYIYK